MKSNETILKTSAMTIRGSKVIVETIKGEGKQDISYTINDIPISYEDFWDLKPKYLRNYVNE